MAAYKLLSWQESLLWRRRLERLARVVARHANNCPACREFMASPCPRCYLVRTAYVNITVQADGEVIVETPNLPAKPEPVAGEPFTWVP